MRLDGNMKSAILTWALLGRGGIARQSLIKTDLIKQLGLTYFMDNSSYIESKAGRLFIDTCKIDKLVSTWRTRKCRKRKLQVSSSNAPGACCRTFHALQCTVVNYQLRVCCPFPFSPSTALALTHHIVAYLCCGCGDPRAPLAATSE